MPVGEDTVYYNTDKSVVLNKEVYNDGVLADLGATGEKFEETAAAEVANIFKLKFKYSEPLGLKYIDEANQQKTVYMGCYGIGVSRLMGVIAEKFADGIMLNPVNNMIGLALLISGERGSEGGRVLCWARRFGAI